MDMKRLLSIGWGEQEEEGFEEEDVAVVGRTRRVYGRGLVGLVGSLSEVEE
jgi:hypothetical protein